MDGLLTALRVLVSLAVVVALVWYLARRFGHRGRGGAREAQVRVVDRQSLSKRAGVAVVAAGERRILVGFADQGVSLITELAPVPEPASAELASTDLASTDFASSDQASSDQASSDREPLSLAAFGLASLDRVVPVPGPHDEPMVAAAAGTAPARAARTGAAHNGVAQTGTAHTAKPVAARPAGAAQRAPAPSRAAAPGNRRPSPLAGSVLSPQTWQATVRALQDRTVRR